MEATTAPPVCCWILRKCKRHSSQGEGGDNISEEDRISNLPESILHHIFSFMSLKDITRTSAVARRWRYLWVGVPDLDLDQDLFGPDTPFPIGDIDDMSLNNFMDLVDRVLHLREGISIRKLRLSYSNLCDTHRVFKWLRFALVQGNVKELQLSISNEKFEPSLNFFVYNRISTFKGLRTLTLKRFDISYLPLFSSLETLILESFRFAKDFNADIITSPPIRIIEGNINGGSISSPPIRIEDKSPVSYKYASPYIANITCPPRLKNLTLSDFVCTTPMTLNIVSPMLETLKVEAGTFLMHLNVTAKELKSLCVEEWRGCWGGHSFKIFAPNLRLFNWLNNWVDHCYLETFMFVTTVVISYRRMDSLDPVEYCNNAIKILHAATYARSLELNANCIRSLSARQDLSTCLPTFCNLNYLKLNVAIYDGCTYLIPYLLKGCHNLETLVINSMEDGTPIWEDHEEEMKEMGLNCLSHHLETAEILNSISWKNELEIAAYLLKNAKVLQKLVFSTSNSSQARMDQLEMKKKLLEFPRASSGVVISVL